MALIKCPECGKEFSDKAPACPNCGCPNESALSVEPKLSSERSTQQMLNSVKHIRAKAQEAEEEYDSNNQLIQQKARQSIDLFGGNATNRVVELAADAKKACDRLYAAYQTLVVLLDQTCRPLLAFSPSGKAVKEVAQLVGFLNEESEIENNFSASLNDKNLGNVASARYVPTMESRLIQAFWETKYAETPEAIAEKRRNVEKNEERRKRTEEAERKKVAASARKENEIQARQLHAEDVWRECEQRERAYSQALKDAREEKVLQLEQKNRELIHELEQQKEELSTRLSSLGALKFKEKKALRDAIERLIVKIRELSDPNNTEIIRQELESRCEKEVKKYRTKLKTYYKKRFPYEPARIEAEKILSEDPKYVTAKIRCEFLRTMKEENKTVEMANLIKKMPEFEPQIIAKTARAFFMDGLVTRDELRGRVKYTWAYLNTSMIDGMIEQEEKTIRSQMQKHLPKGMEPYMEDVDIAGRGIPEPAGIPDSLSEEPDES